MSEIIAVHAVSSCVSD